MRHLCMTHELFGLTARPHAALIMLPAATSRMPRRLTAASSADGTRPLGEACDWRSEMQGRHCNRSCLVLAAYMHFRHAVLALLLLFHNTLEDLQSTGFHWPGHLDSNLPVLLISTSTVSGASTACPLPVLSYCCCLFSTLSARSLTKGQPGHLAKLERDLGTVYTADAACHPADAGFSYLPCQYWSCPAAWTSSGSSC